MLLLHNRRRPLKRSLALLAACGVFSVYLLSCDFHLFGASESVIPIRLSPELDIPPTYENQRKWELELPQHNLDLPFPEGRTGRFIFFRSEVQMLGWNNVLNERLLNSYLAYKSKRAYVFQDYAWNPAHYPWLPEKFREDPPRTPLTALLAGPTVGGPWDEGDDAPRSISAAWYDTVCPEANRRIISTQDVKPAIAWFTADKIFRHWEKILLEAPERCIEIHPATIAQDRTPQIFDTWLWGSSRIIPIWEEFSQSPVSRLLETSAIVNDAVTSNEYLFRQNPPWLSYYSKSWNPYDRMLAIHLRRGDFSEACKGLAAWNATFYGWNLLPFLSDVFVPPAGGEMGKNTPENTVEYMLHCLPSFDSIVKKIADSRDDYRRKTGRWFQTLDVLYLLTNDHSEWLDRLKDTLKQQGWRTIVTSHDLILDQQGKEVSMAVDMDIARRAAVFIGNGWSSFTSNIVHRRLVDGKKPISIRFY